MIKSKVLFCFPCRKEKMVHVLVGRITKYSNTNIQMAVCIKCGHQREYTKKRRKL